MKPLCKLILASVLLAGCGSSASLIPFVDAGTDDDSGLTDKVIVHEDAGHRLPPPDSSSLFSDSGSDSITGKPDVVSPIVDSGSDSHVAVDVGTDVSTVMVVDAGADVGQSVVDSGFDSGHTVTVDSGVDSSFDSGIVLTIDAGEDSGVDAGNMQPDASSCQEQFNCCVSACGEGCMAQHCIKQCQQALQQCLGSCQN